MAELKTKEHDGDVFEFITTFANSDQKRKDSFELVKLMQEVTTKGILRLKVWVCAA